MFEKWMKKIRESIKPVNYPAVRPAMALNQLLARQTWMRLLIFYMVTIST